MKQKVWGEKPNKEQTFVESFFKKNIFMAGKY